MHSAPRVALPGITDPLPGCSPQGCLLGDLRCSLQVCHSLPPIESCSLGAAGSLPNHKGCWHRGRGCGCWAFGSHSPPLWHYKPGHNALRPWGYPLHPLLDEEVLVLVVSSSSSTPVFLSRASQLSPGLV